MSSHVTPCGIHPLNKTDLNDAFILSFKVFSDWHPRGKDKKGFDVINLWFGGEEDEYFDIEVSCISFYSSWINTTYKYATRENVSGPFYLTGCEVNQTDASPLHWLLLGLAPIATHLWIKNKGFVTPIKGQRDVLKCT